MFQSLSTTAECGIATHRYQKWRDLCQNLSTLPVPNFRHSKDPTRRYAASRNRSLHSNRVAKSFAIRLWVWGSYPRPTTQQWTPLPVCPRELRIRNRPKYRWRNTKIWWASVNSKTSDSTPLSSCIVGKSSILIASYEIGICGIWLPSMRRKSPVLRSAGSSFC